MKKMKLVFTVCFIALFIITYAQKELPAIDKTKRTQFFIPAKTVKTYGLTEVESDDYIKVYNNYGDTASIQRVNDIRWQAANKAAATAWFQKNAKLLGEDGEDLTSKISKPYGADEWKVYGTSPQMKRMMKGMGVEQEQYCFTFVIDKYVGKIFVATSTKKSVMEAWKFAWEGYVATLAGAGKSKK